MDSAAVSQWLDSLSPGDRFRAFALIYSKLTVFTRELFLASRATGNEQRILKKLRGLNEIHHTIANFMVSTMKGEGNVPPVDVLSEQLLEIERQYELEKFVTPAIDSVQAYVRSNSS